MTNKKRKRWTRARRTRLISLGIPGVLMPGILLAIILGWSPAILTNTDDYQSNHAVFPKYGKVSEVYDGDTFRLSNGVDVRMIGIDASARGKEGYDNAKNI